MRMMSKMRGLIIAGLFLLTLACASTGNQPYLEMIVPEREEPSWFALSPNRYKMLYYTGAYYMLNLDTKEKINLFDVRKVNWGNVGWVDDCYLYSADTRLVVETETWTVRPIAKFSPLEQARIEAGWARWWHNTGGFQDNTPYYSPDKRYYFQSDPGVSDGINIRTVIVAGYTCNSTKRLSPFSSAVHRALL